MYKVLVKSVILTMVLVVLVSAETYNAVLISLDGAQRAHMYELLAVNKLPAIQELKSEVTILP